MTGVTHENHQRSGPRHGGVHRVVLERRVWDNGLEGFLVLGRVVGEDLGEWLHLVGERGAVANAASVLLVRTGA